MPVHEVKSAGNSLQVPDVRAPDEWESGHIPNAIHVFLGELRGRLGKLDRAKPTAVYCNSGYCPGTAAAALGQGSWDALFGMAGRSTDARFLGPSGWSCQALG